MPLTSHILDIKLLDTQIFMVDKIYPTYIFCKRSTNFYQLLVNFMKLKVISSLLVLSMQVACVSISDKPDKTNIALLTPEAAYKAHVGLCENNVSFEQATEFVGIDRALPPDQRQQEKNEAWQGWNALKSAEKKDVEAKLFLIEIPAVFSFFDKERNRMELAKMRNPHKVTRGFSSFFLDISHTKKSWKSSTASFEPGVPDRIIIFRELENQTLDPLPLGIQDQPFYTKQKILGNISYPSIAENTYIQMNGLRRQDNSPFAPLVNRFLGEFYGHGHFSLSNHPSVILDTSSWFSKPQSPIYKEGEATFLDLSKFDFLQSFGVYPDTGAVMVNIRYMFQINSCDNQRRLQGTLKEVTITAIKPSENEFNSANEIGRVII